MKMVSEINLQGLQILVVEDDPASSTLISRILGKCGAVVDTANNGGKALAMFEEKRYPIIVTDICMPNMDGLELVTRIRQLDKNVQIIATSANRETGCLISAIELGFNDYFLKPLEIEKLLWAVKRCADTVADRQRLEDEQQKFRTVVECLGEGLTIKDLDYRIVYQNCAMTDMFGDHVGNHCFRIFDLEAPCDGCPTVMAMKDGTTHSSLRTCRIGGKTIHIESTASLLRNARGLVTGSVEIIRDISARVKDEQTIRDMAFHDPLTGLANRRLFEDRLTQSIAKARRNGEKFGLIYLDLDRFKQINDTFGHETGDQVLIITAERIRQCCRRNYDTISRHGGDEFFIIIEEINGGESLAEIAESLCHKIGEPLELPGRQLCTSTSIGISVYPDDGDEPMELEMAADRAMYAAKQAGRNTFRHAAKVTAESHPA